MKSNPVTAFKHYFHNYTVMSIAQMYQHKAMILMMNDILWQQVQNTP
jgi:hypothetical protein